MAIDTQKSSVAIPVEQEYNLYLRIFLQNDIIIDDEAINDCQSTSGGHFQVKKNDANVLSTLNFFKSQK